MFQKKKQSCNFKILQVVDLIFPYGLNGFSFEKEGMSLFVPSLLHFCKNI